MAELKKSTLVEQEGEGVGELTCVCVCEDKVDKWRKGEGGGADSLPSTEHAKLKSSSGVNCVRCE